MKNTAVVLLCVMVLSASSGAFAMFENKKIIDAVESGKVKVGMAKDELVGVIGYPPEGKPKQDGLFFRFAKTKVTSAGKEESWTYQVGATADGVRSITFTLIDGKVTEWNEWLDQQK
ncbi:MAG: hypothetical protein WCY23_07660 [Candidatus Omnitrophota bacterium]